MAGPFLILSQLHDADDVLVGSVRTALSTSRAIPMPSPVAMFLMGNEVEQMYREAGEEPRITALWGLWFLLPIIGQFIWYIRMQNAINEFWQARGATMDPGLT